MQQGQGFTLQAIDNEGFVQTWFRRSYTRHLPLKRNYFAVQQQQNEESSSSHLNILDSKNTKIEELGGFLLARVFQSLPIFDRFRMEHVSRLFRITALDRGWLAQRKVIVTPEETIIEGSSEYSINGRLFFRLLMKRCCRYTLELVIYQLIPGDRLFKLLQLAFLLQHICLDSLFPLSGSELLQISERIPELKSLIIRNCRLHYKFGRDFQIMLNSLQQLLLLSVSDCENFDSFEFGRLPSSLRIIHLHYSTITSMDKQIRLIRNIRQYIPDIPVLVLDQVNEQGMVQGQLFRNLRVFVIPLDEWTFRSRLAEDQFFRAEFLQRLTALDLGQIDGQFGMRLIRAEQLPQLEYLKLELNGNSKFTSLFNQIVELPLLRSLSLNSKRNLDNYSLDNDLFNKFTTLAKKGIIEYLDVFVPLNTKSALDFVKYCPKLCSLFFKRTETKLRNLKVAFDGNKFIQIFDEFKQNKLPNEKLKMLKCIFGKWKEEKTSNTKFEEVKINHPWIECFDKITPSHVLTEVCLREFGENNNIDRPTELFKFPPRVKLAADIINN